MNHARYAVIVISLIASLSLNSARAQELASQLAGSEALSEWRFCKHRLHGKMYARTELLFGLSKPDGVVTEEEFQDFIDTEVTPRFPDGLSLVTARGQYRGSSGVIVLEQSKILILFYPFSKESSNAVEQIRDAYKRTFQQESVLRIDEKSCISF